MESNIFLDCGSYSDKLSKIANKILEDKKFSGEKITKKDIETVQDTIYQAYQRILSNVKGCNVSNPALIISKSVNSLSCIVDKKSDVSSIIAIADEVSQNEIIEEYENIQINSSGSSFSSNIGNIIMAESIIDGSKELVSKQLYNIELQNDINSLYTGAQIGDQLSTAKINEIEKITNFVGSNKQLDEKSIRGMYARMMRMAALKDQIANQVIINVADNYGIDIFETDESGKKTLDLLKLQSKYQESVRGVNPKAAEKTIEDFKELAIGAASREIEKGTYLGTMTRDIISFEEGAKSKRELVSFERRINQEYKAGNIGVMEELLKASPEYAIQMTQDLFKWQQNPKLQNARREQLQKQGMILGNIVAAIKKGKTEVLVDNLNSQDDCSNNFSVQQDQEDDYQL